MVRTLDRCQYCPLLTLFLLYHEDCRQTGDNVSVQWTRWLGNTDDDEKVCLSQKWWKCLSQKWWKSLSQKWWWPLMSFFVLLRHHLPPTLANTRHQQTNTVLLFFLTQHNTTLLQTNTAHITQNPAAKSFLLHFKLNTAIYFNLQWTTLLHTELQQWIL